MFIRGLIKIRNKIFDVIYDVTGVNLFILDDNYYSQQKNFGLSECRYCQHPGFYHQLKCRYQDDIDYSRSPRCKCPSMAPSDNLEYLEWCWEQKEKSNAKIT